MFATLDPTLRSVTLPSRREVLLSDTVGFIRNLPTTLVSAFRATLEEVQRAAILLQVTDATSPTAAEQMAQVESVLRDLDAFDKPQIHVLNKIDLFDEQTRATLKDTADNVHISAARGLHLDRLLAAIDAHLDQDPIERARLRVPQSEGKALAQLESRSVILSRQYGENETVELEVDAPESLLRRLNQFVFEPMKPGPMSKDVRQEKKSRPPCEDRAWRSIRSGHERCVESYTNFLAIEL